MVHYIVLFKLDIDNPGILKSIMESQILALNTSVAIQFRFVNIVSFFIESLL